jgi:hypothetical protein
MAARVAFLPRVRAAAGVLFFDAAGRVLLVKPTYKRDWEIPGGMSERDESPLATCVREVREELGIEPVIGRLLGVDWVPPQGVWDAGLMFVFDGKVLSQGAQRDHVGLGGVGALGVRPTAAHIRGAGTSLGPDRWWSARERAGWGCCIWRTGWCTPQRVGSTFGCCPMRLHQVSRSGVERGLATLGACIGLCSQRVRRSVWV